MEVMEEVVYAFLVEFLEIFYFIYYGIAFCVKRINEMCQRQLDR